MTLVDLLGSTRGRITSTMKSRRDFLKLLGIAPVAGVAAYVGLPLLSRQQKTLPVQSTQRGRRFSPDTSLYSKIGQQMGEAMAKRQNMLLTQLMS
jgi:hypothetical protein